MGTAAHAITQTSTGNRPPLLRPSLMARQISSPGEGQKSCLWPSMARQLPHPQWPFPFLFSFPLPARLRAAHACAVRACMGCAACSRSRPLEEVYAQVCVCVCCCSSRCCEYGCLGLGRLHVLGAFQATRQLPRQLPRKLPLHLDVHVAAYCPRTRLCLWPTWLAAGLHLAHLALHCTV